MTPEEYDEQLRRRKAAMEIGAHGGNVAVSPPPAPPPGAVTPPVPGGGAGTSYGVGVDARTAPGPAPAPPPVQAYTSDSGADQTRSAVDPARAGGGFAGTSNEQAIYNPPTPAPTTAPTNTINGVSTVSPATPTSLDTTQADQTRALQLEAAERARARLNGSGSLAQRQLQDTLNANIAQQASRAAGARGMAVTGARRAAARNIGMLNQGAGSQFAGLRAQEETADINTLAGIAGTARGQDIQVATGNAELDYKIKDLESRFRLGLIDAATRNRQVDEMIRANKANEELALSNARNARDDATRNYWLNIAKSAAQAAPIMMSLISDERMKENVSTPSDGAVSDFLASVRPVSYDYKREAGQREGRRHGFMAQDIERSDIGKSIVVDRGDGTKVIDAAGAIGPILVALKHVNDKAERAIAARRKVARELS